jgi:hypothetical protein
MEEGGKKVKNKNTKDDAEKQNMSEWVKAK